MMSNHLDSVLFWYRQHEVLLPEEVFQAFQEKLANGEVDSRLIGNHTAVSFQKLEKQHQQELCCAYLRYQKSFAEARRLGYQPREDVILLQNYAALIESVFWQEPGHEDETFGAFIDRVKEMAKRYGLEKRESAQSMWFPLDDRRDGDAIIQLMGDDRGQEEHFVIVTWYPSPDPAWPTY